MSNCMRGWFNAFMSMCGCECVWACTRACARACVRSCVRARLVLHNSHGFVLTLPLPVFPSNASDQATPSYLFGLVACLFQPQALGGTWGRHPTSPPKHRFGKLMTRSPRPGQLQGLRLRRFRWHRPALVAAHGAGRQRGGAFRASVGPLPGAAGFWNPVGHPFWGWLNGKPKKSRQVGGLSERRKCWKPR